MISYFNNEMIVSHSIVFLCGPYYSKSDDSDRRNIMLRFFDNKFNRRLIPLIIDDFVIADNIKDESINVQLLEEIFASISTKTYIFLDTMSAASELGLFVNHSNTNKIHVMLPYKTDIIENRVGYFVSDIILLQNKERIELDYYRPKIIKKAIATNYVIEHYGFINNELPTEIAEKITNDNELNIIKKEISISNNYEIPNNFAEFNISFQNDQMDVRISTKTLFYMIVQLVYCKYDKTKLKDKNIIKISEDFIDEICISVKNAIALSISIRKFQRLYNHECVNITTNLNIDLRMLIKHILKFIFLYHESEPRNGKMFIRATDRITSIEDKDLKENPYGLFNLTSEDVELINNIEINSDCYFEEFQINNNGKKRILCKYKNDDCGLKARELHNKLLNVIKKQVALSQYSFAYQNSKSIISCASQHKNSNSFIKLDIKNFFNSIDLNLLVDDLIEVLNIDVLFKEHVRAIVKACSYNNKLPLGFTISPLLTEIYMRKFDDNIISLLGNNGTVYTRYADDILLSSTSIINEEMKNEICREVSNILRGRKLKINDSKTRFLEITDVGEHVKYIGINIVKGIDDNYLSVGKKYINFVAKEFLEYLELPSETDEHKRNRFYKSKIIAGKISFIKQVENELGYRKLIERIKASTNGRLDITTDKIIFESYQDIV